MKLTITLDVQGVDPTRFAADAVAAACLSDDAEVLSDLVDPTRVSIGGGWVDGVEFVCLDAGWGDLAEATARLRASWDAEVERNTEFVNDLLEPAHESWDDDVAAEAIALDYVRHLESEVQRVGGCALRWCLWEDEEACDHGYLAEAVQPSRGEGDT